MVTDVSHFLNLYFEAAVIQPISNQFLSALFYGAHMVIDIHVK